MYVCSPLRNSNHGAGGLIAFSSGAGELSKADFQNTLDPMHSKNMYEKFTFCSEICQSDGMFEGLSTPGIYVLSAASPSVSSWGIYCGRCAMVVGTSSGSNRGGRPLVAGRACSPRWDMLRGACHGTSSTPWRRSRSDAMMGGTGIGSCFGDIFFENWMEAFDASSLRVLLLDVDEANVDFSKPLVEAILIAVTTSRDVGLLRSRVMLLPLTLNVPLAMQQIIKLQGTPENIVFDAKLIDWSQEGG